MKNVLLVWFSFLSFFCNGQIDENNKIHNDSIFPYNLIVSCNSDGFAYWEDYLYIFCVDTAKVSDCQIDKNIKLQDHYLKYIDSHDTLEVELTTDQINKLFHLSKNIFNHQKEPKKVCKNKKYYVVYHNDGCHVKVQLDLYSKGIILSKEIGLADSDLPYVELYDYLEKLRKINDR